MSSIMTSWAIAQDKALQEFGVLDIPVWVHLTEDEKVACVLTDRTNTNLESWHLGRHTSYLSRDLRCVEVTELVLVEELLVEGLKVTLRRDGKEPAPLLNESWQSFKRRVEVLTGMPIESIPEVAEVDFRFGSIWAASPHGMLFDRRLYDVGDFDFVLVLRNDSNQVVPVDPY